MNLDALVAPYTRTINPAITGTLKASTGSTTNADYSRTPNFASFPGVLFDVQALTSGDIRHTDALNLQGVMRAVYFNGIISGLDRMAGLGGDILNFDGADWLVVAVLEPWSDVGWTKVAVAKQDSVV